MASGQSNEGNSPKVELVDACGEWFVRVTEKDGTSLTRSFEHKDYAESFADGQRTRLGLDEITRI